MLFVLILILSVVVIAADIVCFRRLKAHRRLFATYAITTACLPIVIATSSWFVTDNTTPYMAFTMWVIWLWMVAVLPRLVFYLFALVRLPRVGIVVGLGLVALFVWGTTLGRSTLRVNRVEIRSKRLPAGFDGYRIVQFSDAHIGTLICPERELGRLVDSINALHPDLVVFTGDLVNIRYSELDKRAQRLLGGIEAPVVSVTGNHDVGDYIKDLVATPHELNLAELILRQREMGWGVLMDTTLYLHRGNDSISLSGVAYDSRLYDLRHNKELPPANLKKVYRDVPDTLFNITAVHLPQLWGQITAAGYGDLTLSGHVHSMQMKLRLFGRNYSPAAWLYDRWSGLYEADGRALYINDGTGYVAYPMRLGAYPEITLFTLKQCK